MHVRANSSQICTFPRHSMGTSRDKSSSLLVLRFPGDTVRCCALISYCDPQSLLEEMQYWLRMEKFPDWLETATIWSRVSRGVDKGLENAVWNPLSLPGEADPEIPAYIFGSIRLRFDLLWEQKKIVLHTLGNPATTVRHCVGDDTLTILLSDLLDMSWVPCLVASPDSREDTAQAITDTFTDERRLRRMVEAISEYNKDSPMGDDIEIGQG